MRPLLALLLTALPAFSGPAVDVLLPREATIVFGLRTGALLNLIAEQNKTQDLRQQVSFLLAATPFAGFDPFHDLDELVVAAVGSGQNPPSIAVITGNFNAAMLSHGKGRDYHGATLVTPEKSKDTTMGILDEHTLLVGDLALVQAAIDRASGNVAAGPLAARIEPLRAKYDFWAIADQLDAAKDAAKAFAGSTKGLNGLESLWLGAAFAHDFEIAAELHLRSGKDVKEIQDMVKELERQVKAQLNGVPAKWLDLQTSGNSVKVAISLPEAEWKKALQARMQPQSASATPAKPADTRPQIIQTEPRIVGAESHPQPRPQVITTDSSGNTVTLTLPVKR